MLNIVQLTFIPKVTKKGGSAGSDNGSFNHPKSIGIVSDPKMISAIDFSMWYLCTKANINGIMHRK